MRGRSEVPKQKRSCQKDRNDIQNLLYSIFIIIISLPTTALVAEHLDTIERAPVPATRNYLPHHRSRCRQSHPSRLNRAHGLHHVSQSKHRHPRRGFTRPQTHQAKFGLRTYMTHNEPSEFMFRNDARSSGANSSTAGSEKAMVQAGVNRSNHLVLIEISASNI